MKKNNNDYCMTDYAADMCSDYFNALKERSFKMKYFFLGGLVATTTLIGIGSVYLLMAQYKKQRRFF